MGSLLLVNPRSGKGSHVEDLLAAAGRLGIDVRLLGQGDDVAELARTPGADVIGMAGGDGSLGLVAAVATERGLPFVCIPFGTRNHFAKDVGIDAEDPIGALGAFASGEERRIDIGRVGDRVFLNNVSFGRYAHLVHQREQRRRRREAFARLRALAASLRSGRATQTFAVDGEEIRASIVLVANNEYRIDLLSLGARERLDEGLLSVYVGRGLRRLRWVERQASRVLVDAPGGSVRAALDGEPALLTLPAEITIDPGALHVRVPPAA